MISPSQYLISMFFKSYHLIRCISNQVCNGKIEPNEEENICMSSFFDVDNMVDHLNKSMGEGTAEKSRYFSRMFFKDVLCFLIKNSAYRL